MTPTSVSRFQASGVRKNASGTASTSAMISSRKAASELAAALRPAHELSVARQIRSKKRLPSNNRRGGGRARGILLKHAPLISAQAGLQGPTTPVRAYRPGSPLSRGRAGLTLIQSHG